MTQQKKIHAHVNEIIGSTEGCKQCTSYMYIYSTVGPTLKTHSLAHIGYLVLDGLMEVLHKGGVQPTQETQELATLRVKNITVRPLYCKLINFFFFFFFNF